MIPNLNQLAQEMTQVALQNPWSPLDGVPPNECQRDVECNNTTYRFQLTKTMLSGPEKYIMHLSASDRSGKHLPLTLQENIKQVFFPDQEIMELPSQWPHAKQWGVLHVDAHSQ